MSGGCTGATLSRATLIALAGTVCPTFAGCATGTGAQAPAADLARQAPSEVHARVERLLELRIAGEAAYGAAEWGRAERLYEQLLDLDPSDARDWHRRGTLHLRAGRFAGAAAAFERALALEPVFGATWHNLALAQLAQAYQNLRAAATLTAPGREADAGAGQAANALRGLLPPELLRKSGAP